MGQVLYGSATSLPSGERRPSRSSRQAEHPFLLADRENRQKPVRHQTCPSRYKHELPCRGAGDLDPAEP